MKHSKVILIALVSVGSFAMSSYSQVLLNDTWADGSRAETSLPNESAVWVSHASGVTMGTGSLLYDQTASSGSQKLWTYFTPVTTNAPDSSPVSIGVGQKLIATIEFTPKVALYDNSSRSFRFGLFYDPTDPAVLQDQNSDSGGTGAPWTDSTGYGVQIALSTGVSASTSANVGKRTDQSNSSLMGSSGAWTFQNGGDPIVNSLDTLYTMTFTLDRVAVDQMDLTFSIADAGGVISTHTVSDDPNGSATLGTGPLATDFDQLFFRFSNNTSTADAIEFSRFKIELVPEPTTFAFAGLMALGLIGFRRLRR